MELKGLKAVFLGDSITEGVGTSSPDKVYWRVLGESTGMQTVGYGVSGTRVARQTQKSVPASFDLDFNLRAESMDKDADIICVFGGTNDYGHGQAPIGSPQDTDVYSFYGALDHLFSYLLTTYPDRFIFFMTPLRRWNEEDPRGDGNKPPMLPLKGYVDIMREVAERYAIPVLDLYASFGVHPRIPIQRETYMPDGLHPNDAGNARLARVIETFLNTHYVRPI